VAQRLRELGHPEPVAVGLGEPDEDLVLRQGQAVLLAQLPVEPVHQQRRAHEVSPPGPLLLLVEPHAVVLVQCHAASLSSR
jgi:hypothetical protein